MIIKFDKKWKRILVKILWKLRILKPPKYGRGIYSGKGVQLPVYRKEEDFFGDKFVGTCIMAEKCMRREDSQ